MNQEQENSTNIWDFPWKYKESFIILISSVFLGFGLEFSTSLTISSLCFPNNIYVLAIYFALILSSYFLLKNTHIFKWLKSPYLAIASISAMLLLVLLMGSFMQDIPSNSSWVNAFALNRIAFSFPFVFVLFFFLTNIAFVTINRISEFTLKNIPFVINHLGILITSIALIFSVGDIQKHTIKIDEDNYIYSVTNNQITEELPFALRLLDFEMEFFTPKIAIVENATDEVITGNGFLLSADTDSILSYQGYQISIDTFLPKSVKQGDKYYFVNDVGFSPSTLLNIISPEGIKSQRWISCGSFVYPSDYVSLDSNYTVVMLDPESKVFQSKIQVSYPDGRQEERILKVNQPINIEGWDIYQTDYDKEMGTWSDYSIIEMVKDPWLLVIYLGIFMLIIGAVLLMFVGRIEKK